MTTTQLEILDRFRTKPEEPEIDQETMIRLMVNMAVSETENRLMRQFYNMLADQKEQMLLQMERMIDVRLAAQANPSAPKPATAPKTFPPIADVRHLYVQEFDNTNKVKEARARKLTKNSRLPFFQLAIRVNTKDEWLVPLHVSADRKGRYKIKETLGEEASNALDFDPQHYNQIGVLQEGAVIACIDKHHRLRLRIHGTWHDFPLPDAKQPHHADGAAIRRWSLHVNQDIT